MIDSVSFILKAVDRATGPIRTIRRSLGGLRGSASKTARAFGMTAVLDSVKRLGSSLRQLGGRIRNLFGGAGLLTGGGLLAGFGLLAKRSIQAGDHLDKLSQRTGIAVEKLQELGYAAERGGATGEEFEAAIRSLTKNVGEAANGTGEALELFEALGVQLVDSVGKTRPVADVYTELADKIAQIEDPAQRAAVAQKLMEEAGVKLVPSMLKGAAGLEEMAAQARELGIVSEEQARQSAEVTDKFTDLGQAVTGAGHSIAAKLLPHIGPLIDQLVALISQNREFIALHLGQVIDQAAEAVRNFDFKAFLGGLQATIAEVRSVIASIGGWKTAAVGMIALLNIDTVASIITVVSNIASLTGSIGMMSVKIATFAATALPAVISGITSFAAVFKVLTAVMIANPIGAVITAVTALAAAAYLIYDNWDGITDWFRGLWAGITGIFESAIAGIKGLWKDLDPSKALKAALRNLSDTLPGWMKTGLSKIGVDLDAGTGNAGDGGLTAPVAAAVDAAAGRSVSARAAETRVQGEIMTRIFVEGNVKSVETRTRRQQEGGNVDLPVDVGFNAAAGY